MNLVYDKELVELVYCSSCSSFVKKELSSSRYSIQHPSANFKLTSIKRYIFCIKKRGLYPIDLGTMQRS